MAELPPDAESRVTLANWRQPPFNKWSFTHVRELIPTAAIANDPDAIAEMPSTTVDFGGLQIDFEGSRYDFASFLAETDTDGMLVLREGKIVQEYYAGGMDATTPHILMSVSKSVLGLVAGILAERGDLTTDRPVTEWVPEIAGTAWSGAALRDLLDMRVGIRFDEGLSRHLGSHHRVPEGAGLGSVGPGGRAFGPARLLPDPHRTARRARRRLPLRLAEHRSPRMGDRAGGRAALCRSRERACVAADGCFRRGVHHCRPPRSTAGSRWHLRHTARSRAARAALREPGPARREADRPQRLDRGHPGSG